jgi:polar amino acid transport system substrate-binding protein
MNLNTIFKTGAVFILVVLLSFQIQAQNTLNKIVKNKEIKIGMTGNQPPYSIKSKDGSLIGYEVEIATLLAQAMKVELKIEQMPFAELLPALKQGKIDAIMSGMTITPERNLEVAFIGPYTISGKSILTRSPKLSEAQSASAINQSDVKLVTLRGSTSEAFVKGYLGNTSLTLVDDYDDAVDLLLNDEVDALVADYPVCAITQLRNPDANLASLKQPLTIEPIGMALPADDGLFLNLVQNYLNSLQLLGTLDALQKKWFEDGGWLVQVE